jgi:glycosyltransferase involved in cell wall biosynthesis
MPLSEDRNHGRPSALGLPAVSVIIPAYNAEKFVLEAIASVRAQDYPNVEIILVDDGSCDGTVDFVSRQAPDVRVVQQANAGAAAARNTGLRNAGGDFICFLDADDGWLPGKLAAQVAYLQSHPNVGAVFHRWMVLKPDEMGNYGVPRQQDVPDPGEIDPESSGWLYPRLLLDCIVHTSTVMIRREVVEDVGHFETGLITGEDYDYWLRVSRQCEVHKLAGTYSFYREVAGGLTSVPKERNNEYLVLKQALQKWGMTSPDGSGASASLVRRRLARLTFDFGYAHYHRGSMARAAEAFARSLRHDPLRWRTAAYYVASNVRRLAGRADRDG